MEFHVKTLQGEFILHIPKEVEDRVYLTLTEDSGLYRVVTFTDGKGITHWYASKEAYEGFKKDIEDASQKFWNNVMWDKMRRENI